MQRLFLFPGCSMCLTKRKQRKNGRIVLRFSYVAAGYFGRRIERKVEKQEGREAGRVKENGGEY